MDTVTFWDNVKILCKSHNLTQKELSIAIGQNKRVVENQIANNVIPNIEEVLNMCKVFKISLPELLGNTIDNIDFGDNTNTIKAIDKIKQIKDILID